jgi:hypothetical protein
VMLQLLFLGGLIGTVTWLVYLAWMTRRDG